MINSKMTQPGIGTLKDRKQQKMERVWKETDWRLGCPMGHIMWKQLKEEEYVEKTN